MITKLYRKCIPAAFRENIYNVFLGQFLLDMRNFNIRLKGLSVFLFSFLFPKNEYYDAYRYVGKYGVTLHPYKTAENYKKLSIKVLYDELENLPYVIHNDKKLFFPKSCSDFAIKNSYRLLLIEQDENSSHRYLKSYNEITGKILLDIGTAEGMWALDAMGYVEKMYLFECEEKWIKPLTATFKPYKNKVEIIRKYVSDNNSENHNTITIDTFLSNKDCNNLHIKMDIEGAEQSALEGAKNTFENGRNISFSICTYHKEDDAEKISRFFSERNYSYEFTKNYFFNYPHLRKAVIRGNN